MRRLYIELALDQAREAGRHVASAVAYAADAAWLLGAALMQREAEYVPVEAQPEYRINTWHVPGREPQA